MTVDEISEKEWLEQVRTLARMLGWRTYHTHRSKRSEAGWPDLALCRPPRLVLVELKAEKGKPTSVQRSWLDDLRKCSGVEVYLWRPSDLEAVGAVLTKGAG